MWLAPLLQVCSELDADVPRILFLSDVFYCLFSLLSCPPSNKHCQRQFWTIDAPGPPSFTHELFIYPICLSLYKFAIEYLYSSLVTEAFLLELCAFC